MDYLLQFYIKNLEIFFSHKADFEQSQPFHNYIIYTQPVPRFNTWMSIIRCPSLHKLTIVHFLVSHAKLHSNTTHSLNSTSQDTFSAERYFVCDKAPQCVCGMIGHN